MISLDATNRSLEVVLAGAGAIPVVATYVDVTTTAYTPGSNPTVTNGTTPVTVVAAPASSTQRQLKYLSVHNDSGGSVVVTVRYNDNTTIRKILKAGLNDGETLEYSDSEGWNTIDSAGRVKFSQTSTSALLDAATHTDTVSNSPTKGSLIVANTTPAWDELVVGSNGQTIVADSAQTLGVKWATPATVPSAATQAEQETGSSTSVYVAPGRQQYHQSAAKAWVNFNGTGTVAIRSSYNVSSITDHGTGNYSVNWSTAFGDANYAAVATVKGPGATIHVACEDPDTAVHSTSAVRYYTAQTNTAGLSDCSIVNVVAFGDQ